MRRLYREWIAYSQSKLANLMFALGLSRRLDDANSAPIVNAAQPCVAFRKHDDIPTFSNGCWFTLPE